MGKINRKIWRVKKRGEIFVIYLRGADNQKNEENFSNIADSSENLQFTICV